jgi:hypothetical protein
MGLYMPVFHTGTYGIPNFSNGISMFGIQSAYRHLYILIWSTGCDGVDRVHLTLDMRPVDGSCECGKESSRSIKDGEFLGY